MERLSARSIQQAELNILLEFQKWCNKYDLKFYLCGGTMLGAARHKGFIPWDDDIDVCMPRPDYEKLIKINKDLNGINGRFQIVCDELGNFDFPFMKILDTKTVCNMDYTIKTNYDHLWIDVLPVDGLPDNMSDVDHLYNKVSFYRRLLSLCLAKAGKGSTKFKAISKVFLVPFAKLIGKKRLLEKINDLASLNKYETSKNVGILTWGLYKSNELMKKEDFEKKDVVVFEGHKFSVMSCWRSYLENLYGDYMKLPPVEKRKVHNMIAYYVDNE